MPPGPVIVTSPGGRELLDEVFEELGAADEGVGLGQGRRRRRRRRVVGQVRGRAPRPRTVSSLRRHAVGTHRARRERDIVRKRVRGQVVRGA